VRKLALTRDVEDYFKVSAEIDTVIVSSNPVSELTTVTMLEWIQLVGAAFCGSWILLGFIFNRKHLDWRNAAVLLLGVVFLSLSGMNLYVVLRGGLQYCAHPLVFRIAKRVLIGTAVIIVITVVLPAKKAPAR
jgi:hypothetical protein